ncbi:MAG TPA: SDR family NAD(P)-dependent oxidoreductase, partial [Candidatus Binatia bacterium]|nr:SDR family NAD(P)-dependent oxidoreductase [Candidatus Binatia bacterium]
MSDEGAVVVVGGTRAIGREIAAHYAAAGRQVVITGRVREHVDEAVGSISGRVRGLVFDLCDPEAIAPALAGVGPVRHLVLAAIDRDSNSVREYDIAAGVRLVTLKLVGYTEVVHTLLSRLDPESSIVLFGGMAKERPYPGSTTVTTVNGGVVGLTRALVSELMPIRVNSIHPGVVGDTPYWSGKPAAIVRYT